MNKKIFAVVSLLIILTFIGYIIWDTATSGSGTSQTEEGGEDSSPPDQWAIFKELSVTDGPLLSVAVSDDNIYLGGESYLSCYNKELSKLWYLGMPGKITALSVNGDSVYAASLETVSLVSTDGKMITEWGPYEANSIITSVCAGSKYVAFADAGNKLVFILRKNGELFSMLGQSDQKFIIPSAYFDVALSGENLIYAANTGNRRIEVWTPDGVLLGNFGEPGTAPGAFCGCCNPAHFAVIPQGFVTAEKGINRLKIIGPDGGFIEFVSSENNFMASVPLDVAADKDGKTIYAANPVDSKLYIYRRKDSPTTLKDSQTTLKDPPTTLKDPPPSLKGG